MEQLAKVAKGYMEKWFSIIPLAYKDKKALIKWSEYQNKRATEEDLDRWFQKYQNMNIWVVTWKISNLVVVDVDTNDKEYIASLDLPKTTVVKTGKGYHYYYRYPKWVKRIKSLTWIRKHVDIRWDGGYVVASPSIHKNWNIYSYERNSNWKITPMWELPQWVIDWSSKKANTEKLKISDIRKSINSEWNRNSITCKYLWHLLHKKKWTDWVLEELMSYNQTNNSPPLEEKEVNNIFESISKKFLEELKNKDSLNWKKVKNEVIISETFRNNVIETILDKTNWYKPSFLIYNKKDWKTKIETSFVDWKNTFIPINRRNSLLTSWSLLFSTEIDTPYWSKIELIKYIREFIYKYVDCSEEYLIILSYYVLFTYFYENYSVLPYLRVIWDYGSGKSQLLKSVGSLCNRPMIMNGSASIATVFRVTWLVKWTLIFDEADVKQSDTTNEFIKILNSGYQKGMSVFRSKHDDFSPEAFNVFWPKIIGWRMEFSDKATESRCLSEIMKTTKRKDILIIDSSFYEEAEKIRNMCLHYKLDNFSRTFSNKYKVDWLEPRLKQILEPILSIIDNTEEAVQIINKMKKIQRWLIEDRCFSLDWAVFQTMKDAFESGNYKIHFSDIVTKIENNKEYSFKNISPRQIGSLSRQNGLSSSRDSIWVFIEFNKNKAVLETCFQRYQY